MARIVLEIPIDASPATIVEALDTQRGIAGWWTPTVEFPGGVGSVMKPSFATASIPFELTVDQVSEQCVKWSNSGDFPPRWAGTTIEWTLTPIGDGTLVRFSHDGWTSDEGSFPRSAMAWARLLDSLKQYAETGTGTLLPGSN
jgi:uncharacterized protein YndB with AHSA1/START domain